jgi:hypothetical protein
MKKTRILTIAVTSFFLAILMISCNQESLDSEKESQSATVEELSRFRKTLTAKDAVAAALYDENETDSYWITYWQGYCLE